MEGSFPCKAHMTHACIMVQETMLATLPDSTRRCVTQQIESVADCTRTSGRYDRMASFWSMDSPLAIFGEIWSMNAFVAATTETSARCVRSTPCITEQVKEVSVGGYDCANSCSVQLTSRQSVNLPGVHARQMTAAVRAMGGTVPPPNRSAAGSPCHADIRPQTLEHLRPGSSPWGRRWCRWCT